MGAQFDTAQTLLETARDCVLDCEVYSRQFVYLGRAVIDCDSLAVSIGDSVPIQFQNVCTIFSTTFTVTLARCCWPTVKDDGAPPTPAEINAAVACLVEDMERVLCCLASISLEGPGIVGRCRPKVTGVRVNNPTGACASIDISMVIETKPCCPPEVV